MNSSQEKEVSALREDQLQVIDLQNELTKLRSVEQSSKLSASRIEKLESAVQQLTAELASERKEKEQIVVDRENIRREKDEVSVFVIYECGLSFVLKLWTTFEAQ